MGRDFVNLKLRFRLRYVIWLTNCELMKRLHTDLGLGTLLEVDNYAPPKVGIFVLDAN